MASPIPQGLNCPGCGDVAAFRITGQQALCGNDGCPVLAWDPDKPISAQPYVEVSLSGFRSQSYGGHVNSNVKRTIQ